MTNDESTDEQKLALATLLLDHPEPPVGATPTTTELWDWMHDSLSPQRASEVETHVARDPDIFEQWRQLRLSESEVESYALESTGIAPDSPPDSPRGWLQRIRDAIADLAIQPVRGLAVGLTMVMVFVTAGLLRQSPDSLTGVGTEFWSGWQSPKQSSAIKLSDEQQAHLQMILSGVSSHLKIQQLLVAGPDGEQLPATDCSGAGKCDEESEILFDLGRQAAAARTLCISNQPLVTNDTLAQTLAVLEKSKIALPVHKPLRSWIEASSSNVRCASANTVISRALAGLVE